MSRLSAWFAPVTMVAFTCTLALEFYGLFVCDEVNTGLT